MARPQNLLSDRKIKTLSAPGLHADGGGLYLRVSKTGSKAWTFIYQWHGKRRETGFGSYRDVPLEEARKRRDAARDKVTAGVDPAVPEVAPEGVATFGEEALALIGSLEASFRSAKHRQQWHNTLRDYCAPFWSKPVGAVDTNDVLAVLTPIWSAKPETAKRVRGRIERVLAAAKVRGQRQGDNPARWAGHLEVMLPRRKKGAVKHHAAMPYVEVPAFVAALRPRLAMAARALHFLILTAARTSEVLHMRWKEIDKESCTWTVPAERMKAGVEHRVPLAPAAMKILRALEIFGSEPDSFVFPSQKRGAPLSNMALLTLLKRMKRTDITAHGFRSSFRDWAGEETDHPREIAEAALAHQVGNAVERSYRRGDALEKRRALMAAWAAYCEGEPAGAARPASDDVEPAPPKAKGKAVDAEAEALQVKLDL